MLVDMDKEKETAWSPKQCNTRQYNTHTDTDTDSVGVTFVFVFVLLSQPRYISKKPFHHQTMRKKCFYGATHRMHDADHQYIDQAIVTATLLL
jgi:hypothetical protein